MCIRWTIVSGCVWVATVLASQVQAMAQDASALRLSGTRQLVVMVGLTGDGDYRERMTEAVKQIATAAPKTLKIASERCHFFVSDERMLQDLKSDVPKASVCTSNTMRDFFAERSQAWKANDSLWLMMIGHTQILDSRCAFNVQDRDFGDEELASWLKHCRVASKYYF